MQLARRERRDARALRNRQRNYAFPATSVAEKERFNCDVDRLRFCRMYGMLFVAMLGGLVASPSLDFYCSFYGAPALLDGVAFLPSLWGSFVGHFGNSSKQRGKSVTSGSILLSSLY